VEFPLSSSIGFVGEAGISVVRRDHLGMSFTARLTAIHGAYGRDTIPATTSASWCRSTTTSGEAPRLALPPNSSPWTAGDRRHEHCPG
jgi:hypothetical protein